MAADREIPMGYRIGTETSDKSKDPRSLELDSRHHSITHLYHMSADARHLRARSFQESVSPARRSERQVQLLRLVAPAWLVPSA